MTEPTPRIRRTEIRSHGTLDNVRRCKLLVVRGKFGAWKLDRSIDTRTLLRRGIDGDSPSAVEEVCPSPIVSTIDEEMVWGGFLVRHYGHFLIEAVARLWPLLPGGEDEGRRVVFSNYSKAGFSREWLEAFGLKTVSLPKRGAVLLPNVAVPEPAIRIGAWIAPELREVHLQARDGLPTANVGEGGPVWLSRSRLGLERAPYDEKLLEWILRDHLTILHPEELTLSRQIAVVEGSEGIAGVSGSAFHTLLMARNVPSYLMLCGRKVHTSYVMQDELLGERGAFRKALTELKTARSKNPRFPAGMRLQIPETLRAFQETILPELSEDDQVAQFFHWDCGDSFRGRGLGNMGILQSAISEVLKRPESSSARVRLGRTCEDEGLNDLALEQYQCANDLTNGSAEAP